MSIFLWKGTAPDTELCGDQAQPSVEPFEVEGSKGAVIVCPGGGYVNKAAHEGAPIAKMLNEVGISAFVLDYRVKPFRIETAVGDAQRAIRLVRSMGYEKVGILGFSAGGNLCCCAGTLYDLGNPESEDPIERISSRPDAFVPCYAVSSFMEPYAHMGSRKNLMGDEWENNELAKRYSAELNVTEDTPPAFIWHTAADQAVPVQNSMNLANALADKGVSFEMHVYPKGRHGLGLAAEHPLVASWSNACCRWLLEMGFGV